MKEKKKKKIEIKFNKKKCIFFVFSIPKHQVN